MLIKLLIVFFTFLIGYQLFLFIFKKGELIEGLENEEYKAYNKDDPNGALILAQQNAGNTPPPIPAPRQLTMVGGTRTRHHRRRLRYKKSVARKSRHA